MNRRSLLAVLTLATVQALSIAPALSNSVERAWRTESVESKDGTRIVFHVRGEGPPLLIVHGGWSNAAAYKPVGELLAGDYQVVLVERRNYGVSETGPAPHVFAKDGEDIHAVIGAVGQPCYLFGHSGGALASLYAVLLGTRDIKRLALYEPPVTAGGAHAAVVLEKYRDFVAAGKLEDAVMLGLTDIIGYPPAEARKRAPLYVGRLAPALLEGATHDVEGLSAMNTDVKQWSHLTLPVLLLQGEKSNEHPLVDSTRALNSVISGSQLVVLPGQEHSATALAPELVAGALRKFFAP